MSSKDREHIAGAVYLLENWPADAKPDLRDETREAAAYAEAIGWIERATVHQPCPACGHARPSYAYFRITAAGNAALRLHLMHSEGAIA